MRELNAGMLKEFGLSVKRYNREFGAYLCDTDQGVYLVKSMEYSDRAMECAHVVKEHLIKSGMKNVDEYALHSEGKPWTIINRERVVVRRWLRGEEADLEKEQDCRRLGEALARLHLHCHGLEMPQECGMTARYDELPERLERQMRRVHSMGKNIRRRGRLADFDLLFLKTLRMYEDAGKEAANGLRSGCMEETSDWAKKEKMFCHGAFSNHSVLFSQTDMLIHGFEEMQLAPPVMDVARLLEKTLRKNGWQSAQALALLQAYEEVRVLRSCEKKVLYYYLLFPRRVWELAADGYGRRSQWVPALYRDKLEEQMAQTQQRSEVLERLKLILL